MAQIDAECIHQCRRKALSTRFGLDARARTALCIHQCRRKALSTGGVLSVGGVGSVCIHQCRLALSTLRVVVADLDPQIGIGSPRTLEEDVARSLEEWRGPASLSGLLALVTLLVTVGGLYATLANSVSQRTKEMAIRRALGAQDSQLRRLIMAQGLLLTAVGLVLGLGVTAAVVRYVASFLYGITPGDLSTQIAVVGLVGLVAWLSCRIPAGRGARVDPMVALRVD